MIKFFDTTRQYKALKAEMDAAALSVLENGQFILGPKEKEFEADCAKKLEVAHAVGVANGSDALVLALDILGIGKGDEVITSPFTFFASAECISTLGATPVFVDIDPVSYCLDPEQVRAKITEKTKAIIPVHIFGHPAEMDEILAIAKEHNLKVIEDCAQAIGAEYHGKCVGTFGDMGTFSFFPTKNLGGCGDGGMVTTNCDAYDEALRIKRAHGSKVKYHHDQIGYNSRLDEMQAALLQVKLPHLDEFNDRRRAIAAKYNEAFKGLPVRLPLAKEGCKHIYHLYVLMVPDKADFMAKLKEMDIPTGNYYPIPLHLQPVYASLGYHKGDLPISEDYSEHMVALPCYPELTDEEQDQIIEKVLEYFK